MSANALLVNGLSVERGKLFVPNQGVWFADLDLTGADPLSGRVTITLGASSLVGTVDPTASGTYGLRRRVRVLGGAAGWRIELKPLGYRNDAGVKASQVAADAARACGETLGTFAGGKERLGSHYLRTAGAASRTLEDVARGVTWWVDYAGVTHVTARSVSTPDVTAYEPISFDARRRALKLQLNDLASVGVGSVITKDLDDPQTITSFELEITPSGIRMLAWCGAGNTSSLARSLKAMVARSVDERLYGVYRYRVVAPAGDRVDLQLVRQGGRAPSALSVPLWPGIAGAHIESARGAEVLVQFVDGDRSDPVVTGFAGRGSNGSIPNKLILCDDSGAGLPAARQGDTVKVLLPPLVFNGTAIIAGVPTVVSGVLTAPVPYTLGSITTGSGKVGIGT